MHPTRFALPLLLAGLVLAGCDESSSDSGATGENPAKGAVSSLDDVTNEMADHAAETDAMTGAAGDAAGDAQGTEADAPPAEVVHVDAAGGAKLLAEKPEIVPLDVRTPPEVAAGKIDGAVHCDFKADDFKAKLDELDRDKTYLVYCAVGGRSSMALPILKELGFDKLYHLDGGMKDWQKAGNKVVQ